MEIYLKFDCKINLNPLTYLNFLMMLKQQFIFKILIIFKLSDDGTRYRTIKVSLRTFIRNISGKKSSEQAMENNKAKKFRGLMKENNKLVIDKNIKAFERSIVPIFIEMHRAVDDRWNSSIWEIDTSHFNNNIKLLINKLIIEHYKSMSDRTE